MATLKHINSKNADYGACLLYTSSGSEVNNEIWNDEKEIFMMMNFKKNQNNAVCSMDCKNCPNGASQPNPMDDSMFEKSIAMLHNLSLIHI